VNATVLEMEQRTPEWWAARLGRATGSGAGKVTAKANKDGSEPYTRRDYRIQLALERLTSRVAEDGFQSAEMRRGIELEPAAMAAYEAHTGAIAMPVGFYQCADIMAGCSPDGLLENGRGLLSLKAPKSSTHLTYLRSGVMPSDYVPQMLHELLVTGAEFYDFASFDDRMPEDLQLFIVRTKRDDDAVKLYEVALRRFLDDVDAEVEAIQKLRKVA
jgi:hypothetical protein